MTKFYFPHKKKDGVFHRTLPDMSNVTSIESFGFPNFTNSLELTEINFPKLHQLKGGCNLEFRGCTSLETVSFPILFEMESNSIIFSDCTKLKEIEFPQLYQAVFFPQFQNCSQLKTASFPNLAILTGSSSAQYAFKRCSSLTSVDFSMLTQIKGSLAMYFCFQDCSSLTTISFPNLVTITYKDSFNGCFFGCNKLTEIHFRADAQSTIEGLTDYSEKFSATNATIYFDL